jgi:acyl carrier protein
MKKEEFLLLLDELIEEDPGTLKGTDALGDLEAWDSLATVGFIALVDEHFDMTIAVQGIADCETIDDLIGLLDGHIK